jgi:hypothetical protein
MGAGDPVLPSETNTGNIGAVVKNKCEKQKRKKKMKSLKDSLKEFIETPKII